MEGTDADSRRPGGLGPLSRISMAPVNAPDKDSTSRFASTLFFPNPKGHKPNEEDKTNTGKTRNAAGIIDGVVHFMQMRLGSISLPAPNEPEAADERRSTNVDVRKLSRFRALESRIGDWRLDEAYRRTNLQIFWNAMFGLTLAVIDLFLFPLTISTVPTGLLLPTKISTPVVIEAVISLSTLVLVVQLWRLHKMYEREKRMIWGDGFKMRYWNVENIGKVALEFLVVVIHPWPMDENAVYREGVTVWMFLRFYLLVRVIKDHSTVYRKRKQIVEENFVHSAAPAFNSWLSMQIVFSHSPDVSLLSLCIWSLIVFSVSTYLCERNHNPDDFTFANTTWYVYTTFLTMDIAEYTVETWGARAVTCLLIAAGVVMNTLVVVAILDNITLDAKGRVALAYVHRTSAQASIRRAAGAFIVSWVRWQVIKSKSLDATCWSKHRLKVAVALESMRTARYKKQITEQSLGDPVLDKLQSLDVGIMKIYHQITPKEPTSHLATASTPALSTEPPKDQAPMTRNRRKSLILRTAARTSATSLSRSKSAAESSVAPTMETARAGKDDPLHTQLHHLAAKQEEALAQNSAIIATLHKLLQTT